MKKSEPNPVIEDLKEDIQHLIKIGEGDHKKVINILYEEARQRINYLEANYHDELYEPKKWYPRKWMNEDLIISRLFKKYRIVDVLNAIERYARSMKDKYDLAYDEVEGKKREAVLFVTDDHFYGRLLPELDMDVKTLQRYLTALRKSGALIKAGHKYKNQSVYVLGYYSGQVFYGKPAITRLVTVKNKGTLRNFVY